MRVYFIRHGASDSVDAAAPLGGIGIDQSLRLAVALSGFVRPDLFLSSRASHAVETARILRMSLQRSPARDVITASVLTPDSAEPQLGWKALLAETAGQIDWSGINAVACVGHEPRLNELVRQVTSKEIDILAHGEAVIVDADRPEELLEGNATVWTRVQPFKLGDPAEGNEKVLEPKIVTKMQVCALLAGFSFTALTTTLTQDGYWGNSTASLTRIMPTVAVILLALSLALFTTAIYVFDRLMMPPQFWSSSKLEPRRLGATFRADAARHGIVYAHMIWTWTHVFSIAVLMGLLGVLALVVDRGIVVLTVATCVGIVGVGAYYILTRPRLGVD